MLTANKATKAARRPLPLQLGINLLRRQDESAQRRDHRENERADN